jgi:dihydrofolate reductase
MGRLVSSVICSLDLYAADAGGGFGWAAPDDEVHRFVNDEQRRIGTMLLGRRMYETLAVWETLDAPGEPDVVRDFARCWRDADKVVHSSTLDDVRTERTRLQRAFDPDAVRRLVADADRDVSVGGPTLAAEAFWAGIVDEVQLFLVPVLVGGGLRALPDGVRQDLELVTERRFASGTVFLRYRSR